MASDADAPEENIWELTARDVMQTELVTVTPETDNRTLAQLFADKRITGVPVVDGGGDLVGVVSVTDLARLAINAPKPAGNPYHRRATGGSVGADDSGRHYSPVFRGFPVGSREPGTVGEIMSDQPVTAPESLPISQIAAVMVERLVHRVIITRNKKLVGIVTALDLLRPMVDRGVIDDANAAPLDGEGDHNPGAASSERSPAGEADGGGEPAS